MTTPAGKVGDGEASEIKSLSPPARRPTIISPTVIHTTNSTTGSCGIFAWVLIHISSSPTEIHGLRVGLYFIFSWLVVLAQYCILLFINFEVSHASCDPNNSSEDLTCKVGTSCEYWGKDGSGSYYCADDPIGEDCGFLEKNSPTPSSAIVVIIVLFLVASAVARDMDQNFLETRAAMHRMDFCYTGRNNNNNNNLQENEKAYDEHDDEDSDTKREENCATIHDHTDESSPHKWRKFLTKVNLLCLYYYRAYWMPTLTFCGFIAIVYNETISATTVVLNGVAIVVIGEVDDILSYFLLHPEIQANLHRKIVKANAEYVSKNDYPMNLKTKDRRLWWLHRAFCVALMGSSAFVIFEPILAMNTFLAFVGYASCDWFMVACYIPVLFAVPFVILDKVIVAPSLKAVLIHLLAVVAFTVPMEIFLRTIFGSIYFQTTPKLFWTYL